MYVTKAWKLWKADGKYQKSFEMWFRRKMEEIKWTEIVKNEDVLKRVQEERNILKGTRKRKASWIGHILRRNYLPRDVICWATSKEEEIINS